MNSVDGALSTDADEQVGTEYLFEGQLARMPSSLAPGLREGLVLSGSFTLDVDQPGDAASSNPLHARYRNLIRRGSFIFDLNHVVLAEGTYRAAADSWLTLTLGQPDGAEPRDVYGVTFPVDGEAFGEEEWRPRWLQIWLLGDAGSLLRDTRPQGPPEQVENGWFRITYADAGDTRQVTAEGPITYLGKAGEPLSPTEKVAQLERVVAQLGQLLQEAENRATNAGERLHAAERRIRGLNQTIDLLIEERSALQEELAYFRARASVPDPELASRIAELEAGQAVLQESREALVALNEELNQNMAERETALAQARRTIARLEAELAAPPETDLLPHAVPDSPHPFLAPGQAILSPQLTEMRPLHSVGAESTAPSEDRTAENAIDDAAEEETLQPADSGSSPGPFVRGPRRFRR